MSVTRISPRSIHSLLCLLACLCGTDQLQARDCVRVAEAVSIQGRVESRADAGTPWRPVRQGDGLCAGDRLRVGGNSRAGLYLHNQTLLRLGQNSSLTFGASDAAESTWLDLLEGVAHFISRIKHSFQIDTPYVNAAVEGTEFTVRVAARTTRISVLEGRVLAANPRGRIVIESGQAATAWAGQAPQLHLKVQPEDAVSWALYYPAVLDFREGFEDPALSRSLAAYRQGDLAQAFRWLEQRRPDADTGRFFSYRAALHLGVGEIKAARADLERIPAGQPGAADALALRSVIATTLNDRADALDLAQRAVAAAPEKAGPLLALSYAEQARFDLAAARTAVQRALAEDPGNALAWSRLAQLQLMVGDIRQARASAERARAIDPQLSQVHTGLGFAALVDLDIDQAESAFRRAIRLDQADPLPRLGLGLALIRAGDLARGRQQIEIATELDPANALIRSYLGKAYYEERRSRLAATQYDLAKAFDPLDPTAWFYNAILRQSTNRPVAALEEAQRSLESNDNRAVYRSRLLLDRDEAARSAGLASIYNDLGFQQLGIQQSWQALSLDAGNDAAHRQLADLYQGEPRHEIARVSELLQAQLLRPEALVPVSPSAAETDLLSFEGAGPTVAGYSEYNPLFNREHTSLLASGLLGSDASQGWELAAGAFFERGMLSAGFYRDRSDGFRDNNDRDQTVKNLFTQWRPSAELSIQGEYRKRRSEFGDTALRFDPEVFLPDLRRSIDGEHWRLGLNYSPNPAQTWLVSLITQDLQDATELDLFSLETRSDGEQYEAQYLQHGPDFQLQAGLGYLDLRQQESSSFSLFGIPFTDTQTLDVRQQTGHAYLHLPGEHIVGILGLDYVDIDQENGIREARFNPKLGLIWDLQAGSVLRLAAFRTLRGELLNNQTLAPTQVAGFNQFYDDALGSEAWRYGIGLDQRFSRNLYGGIELSRRDLTEPVVSAGVSEEDQDEQSHRVYLYWTHDAGYALSAEYRYEDFERDYLEGEADADRPARMNTRTLTLGARYYHASGLIAGLTAAHVDQRLTSVLPIGGTEELSDSFWITDAALGYRLPRRRGKLELQVRNLFDQRFHYQSVHPGTGTPQVSPYYPDRAWFLQAQLWY